MHYPFGLRHTYASLYAPRINLSIEQSHSISHLCSAKFSLAASLQRHNISSGNFTKIRFLEDGWIEGSWSWRAGHAKTPRDELTFSQRRRSSASQSRPKFLSKHVRDSLAPPPSLFFFLSSNSLVPHRPFGICLSTHETLRRDSAAEPGVYRILPYSLDKKQRR